MPWSLSQAYGLREKRAGTNSRIRLSLVTLRNRRHAPESAPYYGEVLMGLLRDTSDQLVQSGKQKLQDGRLVGLFVAEDEINSRRISLERTTRYRGRQKVLCVSR